MKTLIIFSFTVFAFVACGPDQKAKEEAIKKIKYEDVMAVHDEVMPKMGTIRKLKKELVAKAEILMALDSLSAEAQKFLTAATQLEAASENMMVWMRAFSEPEEGTAHEEVLKFYAVELEKVKEVRESMLSAIKKAEGMK